MLPEKKAKKSKKRLDFWVNNPYNIYIFNNKAMGKNMITIDTKLARAFNKAVTNVENIDEIQEDGINWNFVDADIHMDLGIPYIDTLTEYNRQFNHLADCYLGNITLADRIADSTSMNCNIDVALKLDSSKPAYIIQTA